MIRFKRLALAGGTLVLALASAAPTAAASTTTRWVDDDGHAGPGGCAGSAAAATSIQAAVTASSADDVVVVCPGTYTEQVRIRGSRDGLTLRASSPFGATIKAPSSLQRPLGFGYLVLVDHVNDVTIRGFRVITRTAAPCESTEVTIGVVGSRRTSIRGNRLLAPGSDGTEDCGQNIGIAVVNELEDGQPGGGSTSFTATATIAYNEVRDARFAGIAAFAVGGRTDVDILRNSVRAYFGQPATGTPAISGLEGAQIGIAFLGRARGSARSNAIQGSGAAPQAGPTFFAGIAVLPGFDGMTAVAVNGPIDIRGNLIRRVVTGVLAEGARDLTIRHNDVSNVYQGLGMGSTTTSTVSGNDVRAREVGIVVASDSAGNVLRRNRFGGPGGYCVDQSSGSGSHGTANSWSSNSASHGSGPVGICVPD
jgi:hypothetical protein